MQQSSIDPHRERTVEIPPAGLAADLLLPRAAKAIVLFAHGSGSSRFSSRNRFVARVLHAAELGALLLDLLTAPEEQTDLRTAHLRFNILLLAERLVQATTWIQRDPDTRALPIGYFGASTGAAAALVAAAELPDVIGAVVSRGGRPDLAASKLPEVKAPTLLIVGSRDEAVVEMNEAALAQLTCDKKLEIVPGATHLFEEQGALEQVAHLASDWFKRHLLR